MSKTPNIRRVGNCEFEPDGDGFKCSVCGNETKRQKKRNCPAKWNPDADTERGVGSEIERTLRFFGVGKKAGCDCDNLKATLNAMGVDECRKHIDEVATKLQRQAAKRKWILAGSRITHEVAKGLIRFAIMRVEGWHPFKGAGNG